MLPTSRKIPWPSAACLVWLSVSLIGYGAESETTKPVLALLSFSTNAQTQISVDGKAPVELRMLKGATHEGLTVTMDASGQGIHSFQSAQDVMVEAEGFAGWSARVPAGNQAGFRIATNGGMIDIVTSSNNPASIEVMFHDGGKAIMGPGSFGRLDALWDQTYYFSGRGKVLAKDADGQERHLNQYLLPMTGGPLKRFKDNQGATRWIRMTPLTEVSISGPAGGDLEIVVGTNKIILPSKQSQRVELHNGTVIDFIQNPNNNYLDLRVPKGACRLWVGGMDCWSASALADQQASILWDPANNAVDISSYTATNAFVVARDILVKIANRISCSVPAGVGFQYANVNNCTTFTANAQRGKVGMFNPDIGQEVLISPGASTFKNGIPADPRNISHPRNSLSLGWNKQDLKVTGTAGDYLLSPNSRRSLQQGGSGVFDVAVDPSGSVGIRSMSADVSIKFDPLGQWTMDVAQGDLVNVTWDRLKGVFIVQASSDNTGTVTFTTPEGQAPMVNPGGVITIICAKDGSYLSRGEGATVFYEAGGAAEVMTFGFVIPGATFNAPNLGLGTEMQPPMTDPAMLAPRVSEPPVTVYGK
ncbi:MAG: hypothetical protein WCO56_01145 [Verrucomicrobiota bacterium]